MSEPLLSVRGLNVEFTGERPVRALSDLSFDLAAGEVLPADEVVRAGVSGAGFGGINCHITLSSTAAPPVDLGGPGAAVLLASHQRAELVVARAGSAAALDEAVAALAQDAAGLSDGELADFAAHAAARADREQERCEG